VKFFFILFFRPCEFLDFFFFFFPFFFFFFFFFELIMKNDYDIIIYF